MKKSDPLARHGFKSHHVAPGEARAFGTAHPSAPKAKKGNSAKATAAKGPTGTPAMSPPHSAPGVAGRYAPKGA